MWILPKGGDEMEIWFESSQSSMQLKIEMVLEMIMEHLKMI
jgi:hypothetical protein